jgi:tetratricopeptide (TPR) repeat protein
VRRSGEPLQVNVQLIDAETGSHVWADRFDIDSSDPATAQRSIIGRLARTIHLQLLEIAGRKIEQENPANLDARDLVLLGWAWYYRPISDTQYQRALTVFEQALELDSGSVDARLGIASVLVDLLARGWSKSPQKDDARVEQLLLEALDRDRSHPRAYYATGMLRRQQNHLIEAQIAFEKAIALDPNFSSGHLQLGYTLLTLAARSRSPPI